MISSVTKLWVNAGGNERYNAIGDSVQNTTGGLPVWRKSDNWTAFTDGYRTWINGPNGLVQRLNSQRYEWEADYAPGGGIATPTPTPAPVATATPVNPSPTATPTPALTPTLVELAQGSPWYREGVDYADEYYAEPRMLRVLARIDRNNPELGQVISSWDWLFDDEIHAGEASVIEYIADLDEKAPALVPYIVGFPWIADGVDRWQVNAASDLYEIAIKYDLDVAIELATAPWVVDGVVHLEVSSGMDSLMTISGDARYANSSPELARRVFCFVNYPPRKVDFYLVRSLHSLNVHNPDGLARLLTESWFVDGLNEEERIYLIAASSAGVEDDELFEP